MRIQELFESAGDGPKQGSTILKTMDASTFNTLATLNKWQQELKQIQNKSNTAKAKERRDRLRKSNYVITVGRWHIEVEPLEKWIETQDHQIPQEVAIARNWGLPRSSSAKTLRDKIIQDPQWKEIVLDIWRAAARKYYGQDSNDDLGTGSGDGMSPYTAMGMERRFNLVGRKYRIELHVDQTGRRFSPSIVHPEINLPTEWQGR